MPRIPTVRCPACRGAYYQIADYQEAAQCFVHWDWFLTLCTDCQRFCFSPYKGVCITCFEKTPKIFYPHQGSQIRQLGWASRKFS